MTIECLPWSEFIDRSVNDVPQTREIFGRFAIEQVMTQYTVAGGKPNDVPEIVVTGPSAEPPAAAPDLLPL